MDDGIDSGPILGQLEEKILPDDTILTLYSRIEERGIELLQDVLPVLDQGKLKRKVQDESKRRIMPQRSPKDGEIEWAKDASYIDRFIRAQTKPYPGAFTKIGGDLVHIWKSHVSSKVLNKSPGTIQRDDEGNYLIACGKGGIYIEEVSYKNSTYFKDKLFEIFGSRELVLGT